MPAERLTDEQLQEIEARANAATPGPWFEPHISDDNCKCNCRSIVNEGYCGSVATVSLDNGNRVGDGGNDSPPLEEAKANGRFIAHSRQDIPALLAEIKALKQERGEARQEPKQFFTPEQVARLHKYQFGPFEKFQRMHPFTCPNRGDGEHFDNGRDRGMLIPTTRGWICQCCDYTQSWAHAFMYLPKDDPKDA